VIRWSYVKNSEHFINATGSDKPFKANVCISISGLVFSTVKWKFRMSNKEISDTRYIYLGDKLTSSKLRLQPCRAVKREDGKCIRGRNSNFLVEFGDGRKVVVLGRLLRKAK
jgi:hypothetical protein